MVGEGGLVGVDRVRVDHIVLPQYQVKDERHFRFKMLIRLAIPIE